MPDFEQRPSAERQMVAQLAPVFARQRARVIADQRGGQRVDWEEEAAILAAAVLPVLVAVAQAAGENQGRDLGLDGLETGIGRQAEAWGRQRSEAVGLAMTATTRGKIGAAARAADQAVARRRDQRQREGLPMTQAEAEQITDQFVTSRLDTVFGQNRADVIAATEVTASVSAGENSVNDFIKVALAGAALGVGLALGRRAIKNQVTRTEAGREVLDVFGEDIFDAAVDKARERGLANRDVVETWFTEKDARVCPICRPLHRQLKERWIAIIRANPNITAKEKAAAIRSVLSNGGPPAHPVCRCWKNTRLARVNGNRKGA